MSWILRARSAPTAALRLFCFPYAGGGAAVFRGWQAQFADVEICPVQLPGRAARLSEAPLPRLRDLAAAACEGLQPHMDRAFAFFGHSFGGLLAFETARELRRRGLRGPEQLFVSARRGPRLSEPVPLLHPLSQADFLVQVSARYGGIPDGVRNEPELLQLLLPALRADFEALETYVYQPEAPLECPITAFGGVDDPWAQRAQLEAWSAETDAGFTLLRLPGGHFFFQEDASPLLRELAGRLAGTAAPANAASRS